MCLEDPPQWRYKRTRHFEKWAANLSDKLGGSSSGGLSCRGGLLWCGTSSGCCCLESCCSHSHDLRIGFEWCSGLQCHHMINHGKTKNIRWVLISASLYLHWVQGLQGHNSIASVHSPYECLTVLHFKRLGFDLKASSTRPWCRWCQRWERRRAGRPGGATLSGRRRRHPEKGSILGCFTLHLFFNLA